MWCIFIDIEGFSTLWGADNIPADDGNAIDALANLARGIHAIGAKYYRCKVPRLFAYQIGDGFLIQIDEGRYSPPDHALAVSIVLMRDMARSGFFTKAGIAYGNMADVKSCFGNDIRQAMNDKNEITYCNGGRIRFLPIIGYGQIRAYKTAKKCSGSLLLLDVKECTQMPVGGIISGGAVSVNWAHSEFPLVSDMQQKAGLSTPSPEEISECFSQYCQKWESKLKCEWIESTRASFQISAD